MITSKSSYSFALTALLCTWLALASSRVQGQLVVDGGFEPPNPTATGGLNTGFVNESFGTSFGGPNNNAWTVVQLGGSSAIVSLTSTTEYANSPQAFTYYNANSGSQFLDLTGPNDDGTQGGVQQVVATSALTQYVLSFYIGNRNSTSAPVELTLNGTAIATYTNSQTTTDPSYNGNGVAGDTWEKFSYQFTATGPTTIAFYNMAASVAASGVTVAGLDDVSISVAPEPSTWELLGMGAAGLGFVTLRRRAARA